MKAAEVLESFKRYDAFLEGHFLLTSGLHSPHYFQCARVLQHPEVAETLGKALGQKVLASFEGKKCDAVISPALGGLIIGHELGRALGCRAVFAEREGGRMRLRRFELEPGETVVVVEDVVTTGGSLLETAKLAEEAGGVVLATCCLVDRTAKESSLAVSLVSLLKMDVVTYSPGDCPLCRQGLPLVKPGSRPSSPRSSND
ncbi:MAG TPA: orotate phosphoribosyltransferase [archaeon]|nr:orotate phosphoribosyltransferase [archaeon]